VRTFTDPDDYAASIRAGDVELTVTERGQFAAKGTRIEFYRLWMQRFSDSLPRVLHTTLIARRATVQFRPTPGSHLFVSGLEIGPTTLLRHSLSDDWHQRSSGSVTFAGMSLPVEDMVAVGEAMAGTDLAPPRDAMLIAPSPDAMAKLQHLHGAAADLAEDTPEIIAHPEAAYGLEQALIEAMVGCLAAGESRENRPRQGQHAIVMRRFRRVVEENPEEPLYIPDICKAIRVSPRTLVMCCQEHLGLAPKRYLLLRRMHLVRRALRQATPDTTSVTEIATRYGFWQLGRFCRQLSFLVRRVSVRHVARAIRVAAASVC
jgi:AraC-like DNA-binding protein